MITNFQSQNVRSPLIVKQERSIDHCIVYRNETTIERIYVTEKQFRHKQSQKVQNLRIKFTKLRL